MSKRAAWLREWICGDQIRATLTHYPCSGRHPLHAHDHTQISFLLSGEVREHLGGQYYRACGVARANKPAGILHDDEWGPAGALIFTVRVHDPASEWHKLALSPSWGAVRHPHLVSRLVGLFTSDIEGALREELLHDLLGAELHLSPTTGDPPSWLKRAREMIAETPEQLLIHEVARDAGVHRVQLSRMFQRFYGIPPSLFRHRSLIARAVAELVRSDASVSDVAVDAGFYDQAHLTRSLRRHTGLTPRHLRKLFERATSVQAPARVR